MPWIRMTGSSSTPEPSEIELTELLGQYGRNATRISDPIKFGSGRSIEIVATTPALVSDNATITLSISIDGGTSWTALATTEAAGYGAGTLNKIVDLASYSNKLVKFKVETKVTFTSSTVRVWTVTTCRIV